MSDVGFFDVLPLWGVLALTASVAYAAVELGYRVGRSRVQRRDHEQETPLGAIVGATLGLLAFMLAFTFGLAAARFDDRRRVAIDEANAIGTAYLRAGLLSAPHGNEIRRLLKEYVTIRIESLRDNDIQRAIISATTLHHQMWSHLAAAAEQDRSAVAAVTIESLNAVIDLHASRVHAGLRSRIPGSIWLVLLFVATLSMSAMGYQVGLANTERSLAAIAMVLTFSAVLFLIVDLDRPHEGLLRVSQQSLIDVAESFETSN